MYNRGGDGVGCLEVKAGANAVNGQPTVKTILSDVHSF